MKNGGMVGTHATADLIQEQALGMIILGKLAEEQPAFQ